MVKLGYIHRIKYSAIFLINLFILFISFWLCWVFVAARRLSLVAASGGHSLLRCAGFSLRWLLLLCSTGSTRAGFSSCGARASVVVARGLSSCGAQAFLLCGMWDLLGPGLDPMSPALAGGFLTTVPPGKPLSYFINLFIHGCVGSSFLCKGSLQLWQAGTTLHRGAWASHYRGLSCCGAQAPDAQAQ